ncbi:unnamed protein product [Rotaria magnacalcarata]|uniref:Uncharacterized protein n=2 Tax=Rotaria magnacalcarata TaxID=392030 RepID=A0A816L9F1_9BILA|nr:unnamed protein product [Rotaria magnacalcarata]CAF1619274.1 unnamed protein product [Rotaria magnacalcarata]CAF1941480.1 unnamed protein product [Rotaria magnacalcarata]CAF2172378.1 unnamed protein product [Rotaria magnacalcarata]CAF5076660.1 unnamed protein product [Rotaria magnacalcarata]
MSSSAEALLLADDFEEFEPASPTKLLRTRRYVFLLVTIQWIVCIVTLALHIHHVITKDKDDTAHKIQSLIPTCFLTLYYTFGLVCIYRFHRVGILLFASVGIILFMAACLFFSWIIFLLVSLVLDYNIMSKMLGFFVLFGFLFSAFATIAIVTLDLAFNLTKLIEMNGYTTLQS